MLVSLSRPSDSPKAGTSMPKARIAVRPVTTEKVRSRKRGLASTLNTKMKCIYSITGERGFSQDLPIKETNGKKREMKRHKEKVSQHLPHKDLAQAGKPESPTEKGASSFTAFLPLLNFLDCGKWPGNNDQQSIIKKRRLQSAKITKPEGSGCYHGGRDASRVDEEGTSEPQPVDRVPGRVGRTLVFGLGVCV